MAQDNKAQSEIRYLNPVSVDVKKKKYCRFKKLGIKYVDYKDGEFLKKFLNSQVTTYREVVCTKDFTISILLQTVFSPDSLGRQTKSRRIG